MENDWKKTWKPEGIKVKKWGGAQLGSGRKKGTLNANTVQNKIVADELRQRVLRGAHNLLDSQLSLATGCSYLYMIKTGDKGIRSKPILITDRKTIESYLAGEFENCK